MQTSQSPGDAARARDAAASRLRRLTVGAFAGASALAIGIAGVAAATTHHARKAVAQTTTTATTLPAVKVTAPSATPAGGAVAAAAPIQAPTPSYSAPVATSGGS
jgi:hypothetical protein